MSNIRESEFTLTNLTRYFGDSGFNGSVLRVSNMSNIRESEFTLTNLTRYFGDSGFNGSVLRVGNLSTIFLDRNTSLWNASGSDTILGEQGGNVGIGTVTPKQKLEVSGNILVNNTANAFVNLSGPTIRKSGSDIVISD
jgi:hypothetical protein